MYYRGFLFPLIINLDFKLVETLAKHKLARICVALPVSIFQQYLRRQFTYYEVLVPLLSYTLILTLSRNYHHFTFKLWQLVKVYVQNALTLCIFLAQYA